MDASVKTLWAMDDATPVVHAQFLQRERRRIDRLYRQLESSSPEGLEYLWSYTWDAATHPRKHKKPSPGASPTSTT